MSNTNKQYDIYSIIAHLVHEWPVEATENHEALHVAQQWLEAHNHEDPRLLAYETLAALDALLRTLQGGAAVDALLDARKALLKYVSNQPGQEDGLHVDSGPSGGVTLRRGEQHFTIQDDELEQVRDAVNTRRREMRKRQRRQK
jgi:hypothetical protein